MHWIATHTVLLWQASVQRIFCHGTIGRFHLNRVETWRHLSSITVTQKNTHKNTCQCHTICTSLQQKLLLHNCHCFYTVVGRVSLSDRLLNSGSGRLRHALRQRAYWWGERERERERERENSFVEGGCVGGVSLWYAWHPNQSR